MTAIRGQEETTNLASRALAGDARAFREIYDRNAAPVYRFLRDLLGDAAAAEEATQETFVRAHRGLATVKDKERLLPWLFGIARNVFFETLRERRTGGIPVDEDELAAETDPGPSPELELLTREADAALANALQQLSAERRTALLMVMDGGMAYGEIGAAMGWSLAKVKVEIHRARQKLRVSLARYLSGRGEQES